MSTEPTPKSELHIRPGQILRIRKVWMTPLLLAAVFVALMSAIYFGSVINPTGHLHGLPVMVVNQDTGASVDGHRLDVGADIVNALKRSAGVTQRLQLSVGSLGQAETRMNRAGAYATLVLPATLSRSVLVTAGDIPSSSGVPATGVVSLEENERLGSIGVDLANGVLGQAIAKVSPRLATKLAPLATASAKANPVSAAALSDPVTMTTSTFRPLPDHSALGLSAFYVALLAIMSGFISGTLINGSIDSALGYAATEMGPHRRQQQPARINRRRTFIVKWCVVLLAAPLLAGILMLVSVGLLHMYAPNVGLLWLLTSFAALMIATGTLALLAAFGSLGQLLAMILLVYLSLASSGGTVPTQALPGFYKVVGFVEPLRQVLDGTRAIMYFGARGDAGLTRSLILIASELVFWAVVGLGVTAWYDHRRLYRISPDILSFVEAAVEQRLHGDAPADPSPASAAAAPTPVSDSGSGERD